MERRNFLADAARRGVILIDSPKRRLDAAVVATAFGAVEVQPAPPAGGSPICRSAKRTVALATPPDDEPAPPYATATGTRC
jgi:hypothetical protein